jgi:alkanesulfonate monooxygenase SsuD/methylene tetrahydromethanopterin reductase-like flavin-dependent oxidoreductase (luciferase family)
MARYGRNPDHLKILPGLAVTVGRTREEAEAKQHELDELLHPDVGLSLLSTRIGHDLTGFPFDGPLPPLPENKVISSRSDIAIEMARTKNMTIRQLAQWFARQRGHAGFVGTATDVVDQMEQWFQEGACDGFNFLAPFFPGGLNDFVELVVPELQRRGLYRTAYEGPTLRDILGLPIPQSRHARRAASEPRMTAAE